MQNKIIILGGPTASGKSAMAIDIARKINAVIINADSQQIYKEIPIITAQPSLQEQNEVPHRLYGMVSVREMFSVAKWLELVIKEINSVIGRGKIPLLVGGTGMYIKSLVEGIAIVPEISPHIRSQVRNLCDEQGVEAIHAILAEQDPQMAGKLRPADKQRVLRAYEVFLETGISLLTWQQQKTIPTFSPEMIKIFFLMPQRDDVYKKCDARVLQMLDNGLLDEMAALNKMQVPAIYPAMRAHGVREFIAYLNGKLSLDEAIAKTQKATRNYVKRQFTWFRHQMKGVVAVSGMDDLDLV